MVFAIWNLSKFHVLFSGNRKRKSFPSFTAGILLLIIVVLFQILVLIVTFIHYLFLFFFQGDM